MTPTPRLVPDAIREVSSLIQSEVFKWPAANSVTPRVMELCQRLNLIAREIDAAAAPADLAHPSRGVVDESVIRDAIARAIGCGYAKGHNDTVEGTYTDVSYSDRIEFHSEMADDLLTGDPDFSAIQSLQAAALPAVPDGFVLVPMEATGEMSRAGWLTCPDTDPTEDEMCRVYAAMIAAAPAQEGRD